MIQTPKSPHFGGSDPEDVDDNEDDDAGAEDDAEYSEEDDDANYHGGESSSASLWASPSKPAMMSDDCVLEKNWLEEVAVPVHTDSQSSSATSALMASSTHRHFPPQAVRGYHSAINQLCLS